jgi:hypothetical protein
MPPSTKYTTFEELRDSKRRNALNTYYRRRERDADFINKKKVVKHHFKTRKTVELFYQYLLDNNIITIPAPKISD